LLTDDAITGDRNVIKREVENILKYKDFVTEIQDMWNVKVKVIPGIRGVQESFQNTKTIPEQQTMKTQN